MCRLLGSVFRTPVSVDDVLGERRRAFLELARHHGDGWGHAWSDGADLHVRKGPESALESAELADLAAHQPAVAALTHLRWATLHLPVTPENSHPFTDGTCAFAHNGSIAPPAALDLLIDADLAGDRAGDTDSERYFLALRSRLRRADPASALVQTVGDIVACGAQVSSLNALLLTPTHLYAVCSYDPGTYDDPNYYPLVYRSVTSPASGVVVASTGWTTGGGWSVLANGQMLVVDRPSLTVSVVPVATPVGLDVAAAG